MDHRIDLDELDTSARQASGTFTVGDAIVPSLIARIRSLTTFVYATPDAALQADKIYRVDFPELFTDGDGNALYMDEAKRRIIERGIVLLPSNAAWDPRLGDEVEDVKHTGGRGTIVRNQGGRLPWVVRHPNGTETGYAAHELRLLVGATPRTA